MTFANVTSLLALFVALGGGAYAATQLPANSVGARQLKNNAVTSQKIKDRTIAGADIDKSKLGQVPLAANARNAAKLAGLDQSAFLRSTGKALDAVHADTAGNAGTLGGLDPSKFLRSNGKAVDAAHADSADTATTADNAGNANTLGGHIATDFVGTAAQAGGQLSGPFSNLSLRSNAVSGSNVSTNSLNHTDIADFYRFTGPSLSAPNVSDVVTEPLDTTLDFSVNGVCERQNSGIVSFVTIKSLHSNWSVTSNAIGGDTDKTGLTTSGADVKTLIAAGPSTARHYFSGDFAAFPDGGSPIMGFVGLEINRQTSLCEFTYTRFG